MYRTPDSLNEDLYVVCPIFNPIRYKSRWKHYVRFAKHVVDSGAKLITVEAAFGQREFALKDVAPHGEGHVYVPLRTTTEVWIKENLINVGISRIPDPNWRKVAWIDGDVLFNRPNWVGETLHQLEHYQMVQMFSEVQDLNPDYSPASAIRNSFVNCFLSGAPLPSGPRAYYYDDKKRVKHFWHPGFAWAARREAIDALGGLFDQAILGAGDNHMAYALVGKVDKSCHPDLSPNYLHRLHEWQYRADAHIRQNIGCVSGLLTHMWHGKKTDRRYWDRWKILVGNQYDPAIDIKYDWQGLLQLVDRRQPRSIKLRDEIRKYFRERNEDSIDE